MSSRGKKQTFFLFLKLAFLSMVIFCLSRISWVRGLKGYLERPVLDFQRVLYAGKQKIFGSSEETGKPSAEAGQLAVCLEENEAMRRLLGASLPPAWHFIPAKVLSGFDKLKINVGEKAGVEPGMPVVSRDLLVGRISQVEKYFSLVTLVTDPDSRILVVIRTPGQPGIKGRGILTGLFQEQLLLNDVLVSEVIQEGDWVMTSGEGGWLPDLGIGIILKIETGKEKVFKKATVGPFLDYQDLRHVFVISET
ncbi:MAG: rod shape-determining protein MreC [Candidatus Pacebacteria bacterium]|nr:rod shape-determining protein MreC [Candidatus Paceibacterota bacterium]